jgi:DNA-binding transcriptional ArsR family regulator
VTGVSGPGAPVVEDAFGVLANPVRRELLQRLARQEGRASDLALRLPVSRSAVSQHLRLMLAVGVVAERRHGRERYYSLRREGLAEVGNWLTDLDGFWSQSLQRLTEHLDAES